MKNLSELQTEIALLNAKGETGEALKICRDYLELNDSPEALLWLRELEVKVKAENQELIKFALAKADSLWRDREYEKLYRLLLKLSVLDGDNPEIEAAMSRLRRETTTETAKAVDALRDEAETKIAAAWSKGDYPQVIKICRTLLAVDPSNAWAKNNEEKARLNLLSGEITKIASFYHPRRAFKEGIIALENLGREWGGSPLLQKAIQESDRLLLADIRLKQNAALEKGLEKFQTLAGEKNWSDARLVLQHLEAINAEDARVRKARARVEKTWDQDLAREGDKLLREKQPMLTADYRQNPQDYLVI